MGLTEVLLGHQIADSPACKQCKPEFLGTFSQQLAFTFSSFTRKSINFPTCSAAFVSPWDT